MWRLAHAAKLNLKSRCWRDSSIQQLLLMLQTGALCDRAHHTQRERINSRSETLGPLARLFLVFGVVASPIFRLDTSFSNQRSVRSFCQRSTAVHSVLDLERAINSTRYDLHEVLENKLNWVPILNTLRQAVAEASPHLVPGEGNNSLPSFPQPQLDSRGRFTWALRIAYFGPAFRGFATQKDFPLETVAGLTQHILRPYQNNSNLNCAGRTDAGVSACGQIVSFHTFQELRSEDLHAAFDAGTADGTLRLVSATRVPRWYHATFSTKWRRYVYLLPSDAFLDITVNALKQQLSPLVGQLRDFAALGRDLPKGINSTCFLYKAHVSAVPLHDGANGIRIEVVGNRFLRRQMRVLVSSALLAVQLERNGIRYDLDLQGDGSSSLLLHLATSGDKALTAYPAPAYGLVFMDSGWQEYSSLGL